MNEALRTELTTGIRNGSIVPCLGPGVLADVVSPGTQVPMPASNDGLIRTLIQVFNGGKPLEVRLMHEFSRAAMHVEHEFSRATLNNFLTRTYHDTPWTRAAMHDWLAETRPPYVIDLNRDTQLLASYAGTPHYLVQGCARLAGFGNRFNLYRFESGDYVRIQPEEACADHPVLFKPLGTPAPVPSYVASDADYVDYMTELKGVFGMPAFVKKMRHGKRYLFLGLRLNRDTERMIMSTLVHAAAPETGWAFLPEATAKERRFLQRHCITLIEEDCHALLGELALVD